MKCVLKKPQTNAQPLYTKAMHDSSYDCTAALTVAADHPALPGHFPGQPIVPGVLLYNLIAELIQQHYPAQRIKTIKKIKYLQTVAPDQPLLLEMKAANNAKLSFICRDQGDTSIVAQGQLIMDRA